jgi:hypothetical protein
MNPERAIDTGPRMGDVTSHTALKNGVMGITLTVISLIGVFLLGELICRLFFPDTHLRYVTDSESLYYFEPNQTGTVVLGHGGDSPPMYINRFGFRGIYDEVDDDIVLILGDSFTFGAGVRDDETFAARLDQWAGKEVRIINGGQPGYGVFQMAATLKRVGEVLRPRLVIVVLWQGDLLRQPPTDDERKLYFEQRKQLGLAKKSVFLTQMYRRLERAMLQYGFARYVYHVGDKGGGEKEDPSRLVERHLQGWDADVSRLLAMHEEARRYGDGIMLVLWPKEGYASDPEPDLAVKLTENLSALSKSNGIPFVSVQPEMRQFKPPSLLIPGDYHPTPLAHCLAARVMARELMVLAVTQGAEDLPCSNLK